MSEPTESSVRAEVRAWLEANWNPDYGLVEWRNKLIEFGLGRAALAEAMVRPRPAGEVQRHRRRGVRAGSARSASPRPASARWPPRRSSTHGTDLHKEKFLRRILTGEDTWCQLFSEPGSGSDMAGAVTRADRQRQQVGDQRPEGVDHQRAQGALGPAAGARQLGRAQAQGARLLRPRHEAARRAGPSAEADERPRLVQPGVLHRRQGRARDDGVRRGRRLDGGDHHPDARAPRRRRPAQLGAGLRPPRAASTRRRRPRSPPPWSPTSGIRSAPAASTW